MLYFKYLKTKEANNMPSEKEIIMMQKATVYDLLQIIKSNPDKSYTVEELENILAAYIKGLEQ
jgi:hypothetical protein